MVGLDLRQELKILITSLKQKGILGNNFDFLLDLRTRENPRFIVQVIYIFQHESESFIGELDRQLSQPDIDYAQVCSFAHHLTGSSARIGGSGMSLACQALLCAADDKDKDRCLEAFYGLKDHYELLKNNFNYIVECL
ncbi:uncharacterized protein LOC105637092 isoform X2 [Jatropha curcas]|uniref:uncharacterized protein LOC105637092 isoform X2 n=1 Tax=Jatropha curcas TaxID=180498 RepID=UPI0005FC03D3|nr:uncharacterized protein LOC105637092 isoform X2 [Jatropha curcas]